MIVSPGRRRAFATIMAVTLMGLVVAALTVIMAGVTADVRRTRRSSAQAQLRQLLLAGASDATARAATWGETPGPQSWELALPDVLAGQGFHVRMSVIPPNAPAGADAAEVRVDADGPNGSTVEFLEFNRSSGAWKLSECASNGQR